MASSHARHKKRALDFLHGRTFALRKRWGRFMRVILLLQHRPLCPKERDTPAPPRLKLLLHPTPCLCPASFHARARPPKRHHNGGRRESKSGKCSLAGGRGSDLKSRLPFGALPWMCLVTLSTTPGPCVSPCPAMDIFGAAFLLMGVCTVTCITAG